jgi:peptidoglycan/xylan/chitin deacetylase (PgdA/CDA1 family)
MVSALHVRALAKQLVVETGRRVLSPRLSSRVIVLCYHSVHPTRPLASARPESFERHLMWLTDHCAVIPFSKIVLEAAKRDERDRPLVAITFDDGYADNYECAFPLLHKYGVPATFFLTVGFIEHDPAAMARFRGFVQGDPEGMRALGWSQVREMRQAGMEFGAHTCTHPNLARLDRAAAEVELRRSKAIMEERLGERITLTAYPFGKPRRHFTAETMEIVSKVGYDYAAAIMFQSVSPSHSRYAVPRFYVTGDSLRTLQEKIAGAWDLLGLWHGKVPAFLQR